MFTEVSWIFHQNSNPAGIYLFKVNNGSTRTVCEINAMGKCHTFFNDVRWESCSLVLFFYRNISLELPSAYMSGETHTGY